MEPTYSKKRTVKIKTSSIGNKDKCGGSEWKIIKEVSEWDSSNSRHEGNFNESNSREGKKQNEKIKVIEKFMGCIDTLWRSISSNL